MFGSENGNIKKGLTVGCFLMFHLTTMLKKPEVEFGLFKSMIYLDMFVIQ